MQRVSIECGIVAAAAFVLAISGVHPARGVSCPTGGASVTVKISFATLDTGKTVTVSGSGVGGQQTCTTLTSSYSQPVPLDGVSPKTVTFSGLNSGVWRHQISYSLSDGGGGSATLNQYLRAPIMATAGTAKQVNWTYFPKVITVNATGDTGGTCAINSSPTGCNIRKAVEVANAYTGTDLVLIQFTASPGLLSGGDLTVSRANRTIDGTDSNGNPWVVGDANAAAANNQSPFTRSIEFGIGYGLVINQADVTIQGLEIKQSAATSHSQHLIRQSADYRGLKIINSRLDGGMTSTCSIPTPCQLQYALVSVADNSAVLESLTDATLTNIEGRSAVSVALELGNKTLAKIERSWLHNNYQGHVVYRQGAPPADVRRLTLSSNTMERAGLRASDDLLVLSGADAVTIDHNVSGNVRLAEVSSDGDIVRNNTGFGYQGTGQNTSFQLNDNFTCGNGVDGIVTTSGGNPIGAPKLDGTGGVATAYNQAHGVNVAVGTNPVDLNVDSAFPSNVLCGFYNASSGTTASATSDQWRGSAPFSDACPTAPGAVDTSNPVDAVDSTIVMDSGVPGDVILPGQTIRVLGFNFNAIDGNPLAADGGCSTGFDGSGTQVGQPNSCCKKTTRANPCGTGTHNPTLGKGNCVEYFGPDQAWYPLTAKGVTPRLIESEISGNAIKCVGNKGEQISVSKRKRNMGLDQNQVTYCTPTNPL